MTHDKSTSDKTIMDTLIDRERVRGATRMLPEGMDASKVTEEHRKAVAHHVELFVKQQGISRKDLGRAIGYSPAVISEVLSGKYKADWRQIVIDLDAWLEQEIKRVEAGSFETTFVPTSVAEEIMTVASLVIQLRTIGLVYSPDSSGIGKTMALHAIHRETPGSIFLTCDKIAANPTGVLRGIAHALGISHTYKNASLYNRVVEKLRGTPRLLIVDQIHNLRRAKDDKPLYILTDLQDATKAPQLWCGTADMVSYLQRGQARGDESLAQIRSRITIVRDLMQRCRDKRDGGRGEPVCTIEQIREMFAKNKIRITPAAIKMIYALANIPDSGALRTCKNLIQIATLSAEQLNMKTVDVPLLLAALRDSVQPETFKELSMQLKTDEGDGFMRKVG